MWKFAYTFVVLTLGSLAVLPVEMGPQTDPDLKGFQRWLEGKGLKVSYQHARSWLFMLRKDSLSWKDLDDEGLDESVELLAGRYSNLVSDSHPQIRGWAEIESIAFLKESWRASLINWGSGPAVQNVLKRKRHWELLTGKFVSELGLDLPTLESDVEFGMDDDVDVAPPPKRTKLGTDGRRGVKRENSNSSSSEGPAHKRAHIAPTNSSKFSLWLDAQFGDWKVATWLVFQTIIFGKLGLFSPMAVSGLACVVAVIGFIQTLSSTAALKLHALGGGVLSMAIALGDNIEDVMGNLIWLMMFGIFLFFAYQPIVDGFLSEYLRVVSGGGAGGGGAAPTIPLAAVPIAAAAAAVVVDGGVPPGGALPSVGPVGGLQLDGSGAAVGADVASIPSGFVAPAGLGPPPVDITSGIDDYARRLGLGGHMLGVGGNNFPLGQIAPLGRVDRVVDDPRALKVMVTNGDQWRSWEDVLRDSRSPSQPNWGAHLKGSPSVLETFRGYRHVGGPLGHHRQWAAANGLSGKPHGHEHYTLSAAIELFACFDQVNVPGLLGAELLMRRLMLIESAYEVGSQGRPDFFHSEEIMGYLTRASGAVIASSLENEATERLKTRAEISKQLQKAKEAIRPAPKAKGGGKGLEA